MAERERRAAAKAFAERTGLKLPPALDGRGYQEDDRDAVERFLNANPAAWALIDAFSEIEAEWRINRS